MSLYSALRSGVSGLFAQTQAMSMIADNITNVNTTGYKAVRARFSTLVGGSSQSTFAAGVVTSISERSVSTVGQVTSSNNNTHVAVNGQGFFAVTKSENVFLDQATGDWKTDGEVLYTRAGDFVPDENGNLRNSSGYVLLGWKRNDSNTGYEVTNLESEFTAVNVAGSVGQPVPTQSITMNANLDASLKEDSVFTMTAPMYSRQGGISNIEYRFTKVGDGISNRSFTVEARVTAGNAQLVNEATVGGVPVNAGAGIDLWGIQLGGNSNQLALNYSAETQVDAANIGNLKVKYLSSGNETIVAATAVESQGGKVMITLEGNIPENATDMVVFTEGGPSPLQDAGGAVLTQPPVGTVVAGALTGGGQAFSGYMDIGTISFDASGLNPTLSGPDTATRTAAAGFFQAGVITDGVLKLVVDHSADGQSATPTGTDDVSITMNFDRSGASAGMTSYESSSTIYSIDQDGNGAGDLRSVQFNSRGELQAIFSQGSPKYLMQIPLISFNNPNALLATDGNAYKASEEAGVGVSRVPGTGESGTVSGASLESSNADIANEFTEMIVVQRAYSASTKIITTADEMLDEVIRAKR